MTCSFGCDFCAFLISTSDVIRLHDDSIKRFGGLPGMRDIRLLESAVDAPLNVIYYGNDDEREIHYLAATYCFHIIKNHAFNDGNKRAGLLTALTFLDRNGLAIDIDEDVLYRMPIKVAESSMKIEQIAKFFRDKTKQYRTD